MRQIYVLIIIVLFFPSCKSSKKKIQESIEQMRSNPVYVPFDEMECWTSDSIRELSPWKTAEMKLVHYLDSATCSSCYLQRIVYFSPLFDMETLSNNRFYNLFIVNPSSKNMRGLKQEFIGKLTPQTLFVDTACILKKNNPHIPEETMFHTFLLDKNNNVVFVGDPFNNPEISKKMFNIINEQIFSRK